MKTYKTIKRFSFGNLILKYTYMNISINST